MEKALYVLLMVFILFSCSKNKETESVNIGNNLVQTGEIVNNLTDSGEISTGNIKEKETNLEKININKLLPNGKISGDLMKLDTDPKIEEITNKFQNSISNNKEWFSEYFQKYPTGPLPYNEKFGISKDEYELIGSIANKKMKKQGNLDFYFDKINDKEYILKVEHLNFQSLNNIKIDIQNNKVITEFGGLTDFSEVNNTNIESPTGAWQGFQWKSNNLDDATVTQVKLAIGKLSGQNKGILYFDVIKHNTNENYYIVLFYDI